MKRTKKRTARRYIATFADDSALGPIAFGEIHELIFGKTEGPHVTVGSRNDALHQSELAVEGNAAGDVKGFPFLSNTVRHFPP